MAVHGSIWQSTFGTQSNATALLSSHTRTRSNTVVQLNTRGFQGYKDSTVMLSQTVRRFGSAKRLSQPLLAASWGSIDGSTVSQSRGFAKKTVSAVADSTESDGSSMDPSTEARVRHSSTCILFLLSCMFFFTLHTVVYAPIPCRQRHWIRH